MAKRSFTQICNFCPPTVLKNAKKCIIRSQIQFRWTLLIFWLIFDFAKLIEYETFHQFFILSDVSPFKVKTFLFEYSGLISWVSNSKILMMKFYKRLYYYFSYYCCHIMLPNAVNLEQKMLEQKVFVCCLLTWNYNLFQMQLCCVSFANCKEELEIQINFKLKQNKIY